jgi:hypothetical protein
MVLESGKKSNQQYIRGEKTLLDVPTTDQYSAKCNNYNQNYSTCSVFGKYSLFSGICQKRNKTFRLLEGTLVKTNDVNCNLVLNNVKTTN